MSAQHVRAAGTTRGIGRSKSVAAYRRALFASTALVGIVIVGAAPFGGAARAQQYFDDNQTVANGAIDGGGGPWDNATTNWTDANGAVNNVYDPTAATVTVFGSAGAGVGQTPATGGTVAVGTIQLTTNLQFQATGDNSIYTLNGGTLTTAAGGTIVTVIDVTNSAARDAVINAVISGIGGLTKQGVGTLQLGGANNYTGATTISAGTLLLTGSITSNVTNAGTFTNNGTVTGNLSNSGTATSSVSITGTVSNTAGTFGNSGVVGGLLTNSGGTTTNTGTLSAGATVTGGTLNTSNTISGGVTTSNASIVNASGTINGAIVNGGSTAFTVNGALAGNAAFTNNGTATLAVTGGNYTGFTTLTNNSTSATAVTVAATRTLSGGTISNTAGTFTNSGTVAAATSNSGTGTFTNAANSALTGGFTNSATATNAGTMDTVTNTAGTFGNSGTVTGLLTNSGGTTTNTGTISGGATVTGGTLNTSNTISGGVTTSNASIVNASGTINGAIVNGGSTAFTVNGALAGNAAFTNNGTATLAVTGGNYTGITTLTNDSTANPGVQIAATRTLSAGGLAGTTATAVTQVTAANSTLSLVGGVGNTTYGGVISGLGAVNKSGTGIQTLSGSNGGANPDFTGTATVTGGTLLVNGRFGNTAAVPAVGQTLTVGNGTAGSGTLGGSGTTPTTGRIDLNTTIQGGGTLSGGTIASAGTLTFGGGLTINTLATPNESNTFFNLVTPNTLGGVNDLINVTGALNVTGGNLNLVNATNTGAPGTSGIYRLFQVGSGGGTAVNFTLNDPTTQRLITTATTVDVRVGATPRIQFWDGADTGAGAQGGAGTFAPGVINWVDNATTSIFRDSFQGGEGVFLATPSAAVTVTGANSFQRLDFETGPYTLSGAGTLNLTPDTDLPVGANSRTAANLATPVVTAGLTVLGTISVSTGVTAIINSGLTSTAGTVGLVKIGDGLLQLGATNSFTGDTRVAAGTLELAAGADRIRDFTAGVATSRVLIDNNATARLLVTTAETVGSIESVAQPAATSLAGAANAATADAQGRVEITTALTTGARTVDTVFAGQFTGAGTLNTTGTNIFTLTGSNTATNNFTGTVNVGNVLRVDGRFGDVVGAITATMTVGGAGNGNTGTLQGTGVTLTPNAIGGGQAFPATATTTGRVDANVTIGNGGTLSPGAGSGAAGTLVIGGTLALAAGSTSVFDLSGAAGTRNATTDLVIVNGAMTVAPTANLTLQGAPVSGVYRLFDAASVNANFTQGLNITPPAGATAATYLAANNTAPGTQVNARINVAGQIVQFWDGPDNLGVTATSNANAGAGGGTGTWSTTAPAPTNWTIEGANTGTGTGTPGSASGGDVNDSWQSQVGVFGGTAGTVTIAGTVNAQGLQFTTSGYTVTGGTLNLTGDTPGGDANHTFFNINTGVTTTINSAITANANVGLRMRVGGGTLQIGGAANLGETLVQAGTLRVLAGGSIGTSNVTNDSNFSIDQGGAVTSAGAVVNNGAFGVAGTLGAGSVTNNGAFTIAGTGVVTSPTVVNNLTFTTGGTLNATGSLTNAATGTFNLTGGTTTTPQATNDGTFNHLGGTLNAATFANGFGATYAQSAGATLAAGTVVNAGTFTSDGSVTATNSFTNNNQLTATTPITTPFFLNNAVVNGPLTLAGNTTAINATSGSIAGGLAIAAAAGGATFANAGTTGAGEGLAFANFGGTLTVNNTGILNGFANSLAATTTVINNAATWSYAGTSNLNGTDTLNNTNVFNVVASSAINGLETFNNTDGGRTALTGGNLTGSIATFNNSGGNGNAGGVFLDGRSLTGIGTFNNNGFLQSVPLSGAGGSSAFLGAATFNNQANGVISLVNGTPTDMLTLGGNYVGSPGSQLRVDVNLAATSGQRSDILQINGQNSGTTTLVLNRLDNPATTFFSSQPVPVVVSGGGAGQVVLSQPIQGNGFTTFELQSNAPGSFQIVSRLNTASAAGASGSITSLITSLNVGFFQSVSAFIGAPNPNNQDERTATASVSSNNMTWAQLNAAGAAQSAPAPTPGIIPNTVSGGLWARGIGGDFTVRSTNTALFAGGAVRVSSPARVDTGFAGMQVGIDAGVFNIDNTGWNLHFGLTGGEVFADGTQKLGTQTRANFNVPFIGVYTALTNGPFFSDLSYRHDYLSNRFNDPVSGLNNRPLRIQSNAIAGSAGYRFDFESLLGTELPFFVEPSGSMSFTNTTVGAFAVTGGAIKINDIQSILGRFGVRVGTAFQVTDYLAIQPFVTGSVWNEFAGNVRSRFTSQNIGTDPTAFVPILTDRIGVFGQVGVGTSFQVLDTPFIGYIRSDFRFGDRLEGYALNGGIRYQF